LAKDRTSDESRTKSGGAGRSGASRGGKGGRTRPPANVVAPQRPWGLIAAAVAVVVFAVAVIGYAVVQVNKANENEVESIDEIDGITTAEYEAGQHVGTTVAYAESPPIGGEHDPVWADCTGTVYDVDIRHENAVHSLEHGAVWITYNPDEVSAQEIETLAALVDGESGRMLSPYEGLDSPVSLQSWNHQLKVDSADDPRVEQFADFLTRNPDFHPEVGASCENPGFVADPPLAGEAGTPVG
jgi:Protein of unknown function (DUF3105)